MVTRFPVLGAAIDKCSLTNCCFPQEFSMPTQSRSNALILLKADHALGADLFSAYELAASSHEKRVLANRICKLLTIHALCEEQVVYPAAREYMAADIVYEAEIEHAAVKSLIAAIEAGSPEDANFDALIRVLSEYVQHHVEHEEDEMFPQLEASKLDLNALGLAISKRKAELRMQLGLNLDHEDDSDPGNRYLQADSGQIRPPHVARVTNLH